MRYVCNATAATGVDFAEKERLSGRSSVKVWRAVLSGRARVEPLGGGVMMVLNLVLVAAHLPVELVH